MLRILGVAAVGMLLAGCVAHAQDAHAQDAPATQPASGSASASATGSESTSAVDPLADQILRESTQFLAQTRAFSVEAEVWKDEVLPSGHKIQVTRQISLDVRRPDRFHMSARAHHKGRSIWYDGKSLTVLDAQRNVYGVADAPNTIDAALDMLTDHFGITPPLEDLAVSDPYASAIKNVTDGGYFGDEMILGTPCRHIGFSTDRIDWQLWVAKGPQPLPQKLVITYKTEDQSPQYTAIFTKWALMDRAADMAFEFVPPHESTKVEMVDATRHEKGEAHP